MSGPYYNHGYAPRFERRKPKRSILPTARAVGIMPQPALVLALLLCCILGTALLSPLVAKAKTQGDNHDDIKMDRGDKVTQSPSNEFYYMTDEVTGRVLYCITFRLQQPSDDDTLTYKGKLLSMDWPNEDSRPFSKGKSTLDNTQMVRAFDYIAYHGYSGDTSISIGGITGDANKLYLVTQLAIYYVMEGKSETSHLEDPAVAGLEDAAKDLYTKATAYAKSGDGGVEANAALWYSDTTRGLRQNVLTREAVGTIQITKESSDPEISATDTGYSLGGAQFGIYSDEACATLVETVTTNEEGVAVTSTLPYGNYWIKETKAPRGFSASDQTTKIRVSGGPRFTTVSEKPVFALVDTIATKVDKETGQPFPLGSGSLAGAEFLVSYYAETEDDKTEDDAPLPATPTRSWTLKTDDEGVVKLDADHLVEGDAFYLSKDGTIGLPLGTVTVKESSAPYGYKLPEGNPWITRVTDALAAQSISGGTPITLEPEDAVEEDAIRVDVSFKKIDDDDHPMGNVVFRVTSKTTGESHLVMTDEEGNFSTASTKHSQQTNALDHALKSDGTVDEDKLANGCGTWFYGYAPTDSTRHSAVLDSSGALPFDTYLFQELASRSTLGHELLSFEAEINEDAKTIDLGTQKDATVSLDTTALDASDKDKFLTGQGPYTIVDTVGYTGLTTGATYKLTCTLVDGEDGSPIKDSSGNVVTGQTTWKAGASKVSQEVLISLDRLPADVTSIVAFERLERDGLLIAVHEDLHDAKQTLYLPSITTSLTDVSDGDRIIPSDSSCSLTDTVTYQGLQPGEDYILAGTLMDRDTNAPLCDANGKQVTGTATFTTQESSGSATVTFSVDTADLSDHHLVAFEVLSCQNVELCSHTSLDDAEQTVAVVRNFVNLPNTGGRGFPLLMTLGGITFAIGKIGRDLSRAQAC